MKKIDYSYMIRLKKLGFSLNAIAKQCGCKWETVQRTILRCEEAWGGIGNIPGDATSEDIAFIINSGTGGPDSSYLQPDCDEVIQRCRKGEKRDMVWADYVKDAEKAGKKAYQISRFNEIVSDYARQKDIAILVPKIPGQECQVDWVGDKACITDYDSKEKVELHLFVMVLPYSSYFYTEAFTDEKMASWLEGHRHAFEFFGGCPQVAIPDNCATATEEARSKYYDEVILNRRYSSFMDHYGIVVAPARNYRPKDKPAVEASVKIIETDLMPKLRKEDAGSVAEYNRALHRLLEERLAKDFSKRLGSRTSIFLSEEKDCLNPLPTTVLVLYLRGASLDKRKELYKNIKKNGTVVESAPVRDYEMGRWITSFYLGKGLSITPDAAALLAEYAGTDLNKIAIETEKMRKNLPEGKTAITAEDIERNVGISRQYSIFELTRELSSRNAARALKIAAYIGNSPKFMLLLASAPLFNHFYRILKYEALMMRNPKASATEKASLLGVNPYFLKEYDTAAANYPPGKCLAAISLIKEYDFKGKGGNAGEATQPELLMELVSKILNI